MGMSRNPFMPVGSNRDGLYGNTSPSANESTGFGLGGLGAISQTPGSRTGSMLANPYGGGSGFGSMYDTGPSAAETAGKAMNTIKPIANLVGAAYGPVGVGLAGGYGMLANHLEGDAAKKSKPSPTGGKNKITNKYTSMYDGGDGGPVGKSIGEGMSKAQPVVSAVGSSFGPWGMLAAKGFGDVAGDLQEGGVGQHARRIAAASLIGPLVDVWDGWK
jgi:hypothetical protein